MTAISRRTFLKQSLKAAAGLSCTTFFPGLVINSPAFAEDAKEEKKKEALARYVFNFSSPYFTSNAATTPHAHLEIKALIEKHTKYKIFVKIHDGGSNGIGSSLSNSVRFGMSQGALLSVSNLSPVVPELDILNIPFWSSKDAEYVRLFNSRAWNTYVLSKAHQAKLHILFPYVVGARTATSTKQYGKLIKAPDDFEGVRFRVPASANLKLFYQLAKAKPEDIPWGFCARTARKGRYDALDPSVIGLYAGPEGLNEELGTISEIESVHDGWVAIGNMDFIASLDPQTRTQFFDACTEIQAVQFQLYQKVKNFCSTEFEKLGVKIYTPTPQEKETLAELFGHTNPAWQPVKKRLLGDNGIAVFDEFLKIAKG